MILLPSHKVERERDNIPKPSQQMRAAGGEPSGGENPMMRCNQTSVLVLPYLGVKDEQSIEIYGFNVRNNGDLYFYYSDFALA